MAKYNSADRQRMADAGTARPDGSYPIANCTDAKNAVMDYGRGKGGSPADKAHIKSRISALGCSGPYFDTF